MKLLPGQKLDEIKLPSINGDIFNIKKTNGKKPYSHSIALRPARFVICAFKKSQVAWAS